MNRSMKKNITSEQTAIGNHTLSKMARGLNIPTHPSCHPDQDQLQLNHVELSLHLQHLDLTLLYDLQIGMWRMGPNTVREL